MRPGKPYDVTFKHLVEHHPRDILEFVGIRDALEVEVIEGELSTVVSAADKVLRVRSPSAEFLVHLEFQSGADASLAERLFWYNAVLYQRHKLPAWTALILLTPKADSPRWNGLFQIEIDATRRSQEFRYQVTRIWETPVEVVLQGGVGLLPLAPICQDAESKVEQIVDRMDQRFRAEASEEERKDLWAATYYLMGLRFEPDLIARVIRGGKDMEESVTYQMTLEKGRVQGISQGISQGLSQGMAQEARKIVLRLGRRLLGNPSSAAQAALEMIDDVKTLEDLAKKC